MSLSGGWGGERGSWSETFSHLLQSAEKKTEQDRFDSRDFRRSINCSEESGWVRWWGGEDVEEGGGAVEERPNAGAK